MAIEFTYARRLEEIIQPAVDYLSHATGDLFVKQRIIVPTAGMKAWLLAELATRLGATASHDGIVANVPPMQKMSSDRCRQEAHERRCAQADLATCSSGHQTTHDPLRFGTDRFLRGFVSSATFRSATICCSTFARVVRAFLRSRVITWVLLTELPVHIGQCVLKRRCSLSNRETHLSGSKISSAVNLNPLGRRIAHATQTTWSQEAQLATASS